MNAPFSIPSASMTNRARVARQRGARSTSFLLVSAIASLASTPIAARQPLSARDPQQWFDNADLNKDGAITKEEFLATRAKAAKQLDRNGDGVIDTADAPRLPRAKTQYEERMSEIKLKFDLNHDGVVTTEEFANGPTAIFDLVDANGDGALVGSEIEAVKTALNEQRAQQ